MEVEKKLAAPVAVPWLGPLRLLALLTALTLLLSATPASAELTQKGNLFVHFGGGIAPNALPRHSRASIAVRIEGTIRVIGGNAPPALRRIKIALNRAGHLDATGLPVCHKSEIDALSTSAALARCGPALVGGGGFTARTDFPDQANVTTPGEILLFNARINGRPAVLAHVYQTNPTPITRIIVFKITHSAGAFGTVITGLLPPSINNNGYLKSIYLQLQRRYSYHGVSHAYLSAACAAPAGFSSAIFPFARASMSFDDGRTLSSVLTRSCRVRG
jgi:hypothetical protein